MENKEALNISLNSKEEINKLIELLDNPYCKEYIKRKLNDIKNIDEEDAAIISRLAFAYAIKKIIPENKYKDIVIEKGITTEENVTLFGESRKENGKYINRYYEVVQKCIASKDIFFFCRALSTFAHELYHTKQRLDAENDVIDLNTLLYCLENVVGFGIKGKYKEDYKKLFFELKAEIVGARTAVEFINEYSTLKKANVDDYVELWAKRKNPDYEDFFNINSLKEYIIELLKNIKEHNLITKDTIKEYPVLRFFFREDSKFQTPEYFETMSNYTSIIEDKKERENKIFFCRIMKEVAEQVQKTSSHK